MLKDRLRLPPCSVGAKGFCCKACLMGPCRLPDEETRGVCGASRDLVSARNLLRTVAAGTAAHCGHARHVLEFSGMRGSGKKTGNSQFWEISEALHVSSMGVGADPEDLLSRCLKTAALDGSCGLYPATAREDAILGRPKRRDGHLELACLDAGKVNIAVHGHEPALLKALATAAAASPDINLVGVCCTGASLLASMGVPLAAAFTMQEDVVATGIVEAMVVDSQCVMPSLPDLCECFHTRLIAASSLARIPGALHLPSRSPAEASAAAVSILKLARENRKNRSAAAEFAFRTRPAAPKEAVVGFSEYNLDLRETAARLKSGNLKGVVAAVGCVNPRSKEGGWVNTFRELSADHLILTTGCMAFELGRNGLLDGKRVFHMGSCVNNARIAEVFKRLADILGRKIPQLPFWVSCPMPITEKSAAIGLYFATLGCGAHFGEPFPISPGTRAAAALAGLIKADYGGTALLEASPAAFAVRVREGRAGRKGLPCVFPDQKGPSGDCSHQLCQGNKGKVPKQEFP